MRSGLTRPIMTPKPSRLALFALVAAGASSCSFAVGELPDTQCDTSADCVQLGFADATCSSGLCIDERLACIERRSPAPVGPVYEFRVRAISGETMEGQARPPPGLVATACPAPFIDCPEPVRGSVAEDGVIGFGLPSGVSYIVELSAPDTFPALVSFLYPLEAEAGEVLRHRPDVPLVSNQQFALLAALLDVEPLPDRSHVLGVVEDCQLQPVSGARVSFADEAGVPGEARIFYFGNNEFPSRELEATQDFGVFIVVNVPPFTGLRIVAEDGTELVPPTTIPGKAGSITYMSFPPGAPDDAFFAPAE